jgi:hypothetical protein
MKKSEFFAVSQFLTDWPDGLSFSEILQAVVDLDESITCWEMVERWPADDLAEAIEMLEAAFSRAVADILNEEKNPQPTESFNTQLRDPVQFLRDHLRDHFQIIHVK